MSHLHPSLFPRNRPEQFTGLSGWWKNGDWTATNERVSEWRDTITGAYFEPYVTYTNTASGYASTPDSVPLDIVGDISFIFRMAMDDWSPTAVQYPLTKSVSTGNQRSYVVRSDSSGTIRLMLSADGVTFAEKVSSVLPATNAEYLYVMATVDVDNGAGGYDVKFYTAADATTLPTAWTQLGSTVTTAGILSIFASTAPVTIAGLNSVGSFAGKIKRALIYSGVVASDGTGGTIVADYNPSIQPHGTTSWVSASPNTETWTQQGGTSVTGSKSLRQATTGGQPIELPWTGENYGWLPSANSNNFNVNDAAQFDLTPTFDIIFRSQVQWTLNSVNQVLIAHASAAPAFGWGVRSAGAGIINFAYTEDGTTQRTVAASSVSPIPDMTNAWFRVKGDLTAGTINFYYAADSSAVPASWTQWGTANRAITAGTIAAVAAPLSIGVNGGLIGANLLGGSSKWFRIQLWHGFSDAGGTKVFDADFTTAAEGASSFLETSSYGATVNVAATSAKQAQIVGSKQIVGDAVAYFMRAAYVQAQPCTRFFLVKKPTWTSGRYTADGVGANSAAIVSTTGTPKLSMNAGTPTQNENAGATLGTYHAMCMVWDGASSKFIIDTTEVTGGNPGTTTTGGLTIFADGQATAANFGSGQMKEIIEYNRAMPGAEVGRLLRYLSRLGNIGI